MIDHLRRILPDVETSFRGRVEDANPESRDSGSGPSDHPGMTNVRQERLCPPPPCGEGWGGGATSSVLADPPPRPLPARGRGEAKRHNFHESRLTLHHF